MDMTPNPAKRWDPATFLPHGGAVDDVTQTNGLRADRAYGILKRFAVLLDCPDAALDSDHVTDLLADVMHLCHREGVNFDDSLGMASMHYAAETEWPAAKDWIEGTQGPPHLSDPDRDGFFGL